MGSIKSLLTDLKLKRVVFYSGYTNLSGIKLFEEEMHQAIGRGVDLTFNLGLSYESTTPETLKYLAKSNIKTKLILQSDKGIFHTKFFLFVTKDIAKIIVGSNNLTKPGLMSNIETSILNECTIQKATELEEHINSQLHELTKVSNKFILSLSSENLDQILSTYGNLFQTYTIDNSAIIKSNKLDYFQLDNGNPETNSKEIDEPRPDTKFFENWYEKLEEFKVYYKKFDSPIVKRTYSSLNKWVTLNKKFYMVDTLPKEYVEILQSNNFFFGDGHEYLNHQKWLVRYNEYIDFIQKEGTSYLQRIKDKNDPMHSLSNWVAQQRSLRNRNKLSKLRIELLDKVNFPWLTEQFGDSGNRLDDDGWFEWFIKLEKYKSEFGHANPSQTDDNKEIARLGHWVSDQRHLHNNGKKNASGTIRWLSDDRVALLEDIGVEWDYKNKSEQRRFLKKVEKFISFRKLYPNLDPPPGEFIKERNWRSQVKYHFHKLPDWKKSILLGEKII